MSSPLSPGHVVAGRYRVEAPIGEGGMGIVYLVRHVHTDEKLAMKVLHAHALRDASAVERFRREARAPAQIASEHVARVTDADTAAELGGAPFYVMEYLQGKDLERVVKEHGALPPETVVEYLRQVARALDKAHGMGIVHRDLKPENLFLTEREDGTPCIKLLDFGIARLAGGDMPAHLKTQAGVMFGTPAFMSPEQMEGDLERIGPPTDIWSLGLIAFKLLCKEDFWTGSSVAVVCAQVLSVPIPTPTIRGSKYGPAFDAWFARCANRDVGARFKTAGEAVVALAEALGIPLPPQRRTASLVGIAIADAASMVVPMVPASTPGGAPAPPPSTPGGAPPSPPSGGGLPPPAPSSPGGGVPLLSPGAGPAAASPAGAAEPPSSADLGLGAVPPSPRPPSGTMSPTSQGEPDAAPRSRAGTYIAVLAVTLVGAAVAAFFLLPKESPSAEGRPDGSVALAASAPSADAAGPPEVPSGAPGPEASAAPDGSAGPTSSASAPDGSAAAAPQGSGAPAPSLGGPRPSGWPAGGRPPETGETSAAPPPPAPPPTSPSAPSTGSKPPPTSGGAPSSDQKQRLAALQRLCDKGLLTPAECAAKRQAILQGSQ